MQFFNEFKNGVYSYLDAIHFIKKNKLYGLFFLSVFIFAILYFISFVSLKKLIAFIIDYFLHLSFMHAIMEFFEKLPWLFSILEWTMTIAIVFLFISFFKFIFLAIASPLYAYISEKCAERFLQKIYPFNLKQFLKDIGRGMRISLRNFFRQLFLTAIFFVCSFIPILGLFFVFALVILDSYYYGFSMMDYSCEREKMKITQAVHWMKKHKGLVIGNGFIFYLSIYFVPIFGVVIMAPLSAIAATLSFYQIEKK